MNSLIEQTYPNWEAIVVDDGSTDSSVDIIKEYTKKDPRIFLYQHKKAQNKGLAESIQLALSKSKGTWIAFCESDDWWAPNCLEKRLEILKRYPQSFVVFNDVVVEGQNAGIYHVKKKIHSLYNKTKMESVLSLYPEWNAVTTFSCAMVQKSELEKCHFKPILPVYLDRWIWTQLAFKGSFLYLDIPLTHWRQHSESYTRRNVTSKNTDGSSPRGDVAILRTALKVLMEEIYPSRKWTIFYHFTLRPIIKSFFHIFYQKRVDEKYIRTFFFCFRIRKKLHIVPTEESADSK